VLKNLGPFLVQFFLSFEDSKKTGNDSCFGFEEVKTSLLVSPVRKLPITPMSDYASIINYD
jgi:hypothetical protein